jgi:hypothetical protein
VPRFRQYSSEVATVEQDNGGRDEVEGCYSARLVFVAAIRETPQTMESDRAKNREYDH